MQDDAPSFVGDSTVGLMVTCLVDLFRPSVGFSTVALLESEGMTVTVPSQTCCGQPAFNSGDRENAISLAKQVIESFEDFDYVVVPSASCAGMISKHYPKLLAEDPQWLQRSNKLAAKTWELTAFLVRVCDVKKLSTRCPAKVTLHHSCSALRELKIRDEPRLLLEAVRDLEYCDLRKSEECCGFGGTFCVKFPEVSAEMVSNKVDEICHTEADLVVSTDLGCLLNIAGRMERLNKSIAVRHIAEVLAGNYDSPPIGHGSD